jgi:hypothetical protein
VRQLAPLPIENDRPRFPASDRAIAALELDAPRPFDVSSATEHGADGFPVLDFEVLLAVELDAPRLRLDHVHQRPRDVFRLVEHLARRAHKAQRLPNHERTVYNLTLHTASCLYDYTITLLTKQHRINLFAKFVFHAVIRQRFRKHHPATAR